MAPERFRSVDFLKGVKALASAAPAVRGLKRICTNCGTRFYDMDKRPILCPSCGTEFTGDSKLKVRRARPAIAEDAPPPVAEEERDIEVVSREDDVVSLEDVEEDADEGEDSEVEGDLEELDAIEDDEDLEEEIDVDVGKDADR